MLSFSVSELIHVCSRATPYLQPIRTQGHQLIPRWFAPREIPPNSRDEIHIHHLYEAQICINGHGHFLFSREQPVVTGSITLCPPHTRHTLHTDDTGGVFVWAGFDVEPAVHVTEPEHWPIWPTVLHDLETIVEENHLHLGGWAERAGMRLSLILSRTLTLADPHAEFHAESINYQALVGEVDRYCEMYYAQPIRLQDIADYFHMSPRTLMRWYQRLTGTTIMAYLHSVRLRKAAWLLQHSSLSIAEVAGSCGLEANYFSQTFRKQYQMTPQQYRQTQQNQTAPLSNVSHAH